MKYPMFSIDNETLGLGTNSVILQVAVVAFNPWVPSLSARLNLHINIQSQIDMGRDIDGSTLLWWMGQSDETRGIQMKGQRGALRPSVAAAKIRDFIKMHAAPNALIWGDRIVDMDNITTLMKQSGVVCPWQYSEEREYRNLWNTFPDVEKLEFVGIKHNAIDDAVNTAYQIINIITSKGITTL
jgi:hypothetical protein